jgi:hypothetical protein
MKRCTRCVLPENYPGIEFNEAGVCNYCLTHRKWRYKGKEELDKFLGPFRNKDGRYDCVVGISGGRDSSYALYYLVKVCNLRVLAYTGDNGFIPQVAKTNMKIMTDILDVELVTEEHHLLKRCIKTNVSSWLRKPSPAMIPMICIGCKLGILRGLLECARKNKIPLVVFSVATPIEIGLLKRRLLTTNLFGRSVSKSKSLSLLFGLLYEIIQNPCYLTPINTIVNVREYLYLYAFQLERVQRLFYPHQKILDLFQYIEWNEDKILSTIKTELNWKKSLDSASSWRFDCRVNFLKNYLLRESLGITANDDCLSVMIRENMITREEALERLEIENILPQKLITELLDEIGINPSNLSVAVAMARRNTEMKNNR